MANPKRPGLVVGVVGASGLVGRILLEVFERRAFPVGRLAPFGSGRAGSWALFRGRRIPCREVSTAGLRACDIVFFVSSDSVSKRCARALAGSGVWVIDDSSAFRLDPAVPLVIPEVNASALSAKKRLIAGPNCTLTGAAVAGAPLLRKAGFSAVRLASYQSVSGAGRAALEEFHSQMRRAAPLLGKRGLLDVPAFPASRAMPRPIALNLFPQVGAFDRFGDSGEEFKVREELRKIWALPGLPISVTAVRVPVVRCHSLALWIETRKPICPSYARGLLRRAPGLRLWSEGDYPTPASVAGTGEVHVGRVRQGLKQNELALWVVSDNLLKGAALNSVQIAEILLHKGWLKPSNIC
ncbi:MAG: aspartate-semialdehyde dehydrogenase [Elusimicrobia bacterium]|nr:aspartate-semialdehyde dehydrogenase [Elusimicrobiota bacterium]